MLSLYDSFKKLSVVTLSLCAALLEAMPAIASSFDHKNTTHDEADIKHLYGEALLAAESLGMIVIKRANKPDFKHIDISPSPTNTSNVNDLNQISSQLTKTLNAQFGTAKRHIYHTQSWTDDMTQTQISLWREANSLTFSIDQRSWNAVLFQPTLTALAQGQPVKIIHKSSRDMIPTIAQNQFFEGVD